MPNNLCAAPKLDNLKMAMAAVVRLFQIPTEHGFFFPSSISKKTEHPRSGMPISRREVSMTSMTPAMLPLRTIRPSLE